jgi:hypothetical protein
VHREPDQARPVGERPGDGLPDPPRGVGRELEAPPVLEAIDGLAEADVPLLHEIREGELAAAVALGDGDDEAEVRLHQLALGRPRLPVRLGDLLQDARQRHPVESHVCLPAPSRRALRGGERVGETPQLDDRPVHHVGPDRQLGDEVLDRRSVSADGPPDDRPIGGAPPGEPRLQAAGLPLTPAHVAHGREEATHLGGRGLAALGQPEHVVEGSLLGADLVGHVEQSRHHPRDGRERTAELRLPQFDALAQGDLLGGGEQGVLRDLAEI